MIQSLEPDLGLCLGLIDHPGRPDAPPQGGGLLRTDAMVLPEKATMETPGTCGVTRCGDRIR